MQNKLDEILNDNTSGSVEIYEKILSFLSEEVQRGTDIAQYLPRIKTALNEFSIVTNLISELENTPHESVKSVLEKHKKNERAFELLYRNFKPKLFDGVKIVTISNSGTLVKLFEYARKDFEKIKIYVSESRPVFEGRIMAEKLSRTSFEVTLITEAMLPSFVETSDFGLIGADKILANGNAVNKIGSKIIALACKHYAKPLYAVATKNKFTSEKILTQKPHPVSEIIEDARARFSVAENIYFEEIEGDLITEIITD